MRKTVTVESSVLVHVSVEVAQIPISEESSDHIPTDIQA